MEIISNGAYQYELSQSNSQKTLSISNVDSGISRYIQVNVNSQLIGIDPINERGCYVIKDDIDGLSAINYYYLNEDGNNSTIMSKNIGSNLVPRVTSLINGNGGNNFLLHELIENANSPYTSYYIGNISDYTQFS